eukprot:11539941-Alexandrium_andersonii.AAC.1
MPRRNASLPAHCGAWLAIGRSCEGAGEAWAAATTPGSARPANCAKSAPSSPRRLKSCTSSRTTGNSFRA